MQNISALQKTVLERSLSLDMNFEMDYSYSSWQYNDIFK